MKRLAVVALAGLATGVVIALLVLLLVRVDRNQRSNTAALCALRADVARRVSAGEKFLRSHPRGIPGIPAPLLRSSISDERRTVRALSPLTCAPAPLIPTH